MDELEFGEELSQEEIDQIISDFENMPDDELEYVGDEEIDDEEISDEEISDEEIMADEEDEYL